MGGRREYPDKRGGPHFGVVLCAYTYLHLIDMLINAVLTK